MQKKIQKLIELQTVEAEGDQLAAFIKKAPEQIKYLDLKLDDAQNAFDGEEETLETLRKKYRDSETDIQTNLSLIDKSQVKLSSVKTNKEYQAMLKEIDELRKLNAKIEDEMLILLEQIESTESELGEKKRVLEELVSNISAEKAVVTKKAEAKELELSSIEEKVSGLAQQIDSDLMSAYHRVKSMVTGSAVVPVTNAVCKGCHLNIPPQMYNELQRGDNLKFCPHCARILYWQNEETDLE